MLLCVLKFVDEKVEVAPFVFREDTVFAAAGEFGEFFNLIAANHRNFHKCEKLRML